MAGIPVLLSALARAHWRQWRTAEAALGNQFVLFCLVLTTFVPKGASLVQFVIALPLVFSMGHSPASHIPNARRPLLPIGRRDWILLQLAAWLLSPMTWLPLALAILGGPPYRRFAVAIVVLQVTVQLVRLSWTPIHEVRPTFQRTAWIPKLPGTLGPLIRKNIREQLCLLDTSTALLLSLAGGAYRVFTAHPAPEAAWGASLMIALAMSTSTQRLFALDEDPVRGRYAMLPLRGWQVLLAKDIAFLALLFLMVLPLNPVVGLSAGTATLALGHGPSIENRAPQQAFHFTSSSSRPVAILQVAVVFAFGLAASRCNVVLLGSVAAWFISLFFYGHKLDQRL